MNNIQIESEQIKLATDITGNKAVTLTKEVPLCERISIAVLSVQWEALLETQMFFVL